MGENPERADLWLARDNDDPDIAVVGLPWAREAPGRARVPLEARDRLRRFSTYHSERDTDFSGLAAADAGNWPVTGVDLSELIDYLKNRIPDLEGRLRIFLGGEDAVSEAIIESLPAETVGVIRFTVRPTAGDSLLADRDVALIGVQGFAASASDHEAARHSGTSTISNRQMEKEGMRMTVDRALGKLAMSEVIHVSVDLDVLDQSHVPGAPDALPGGLTVRQLSDAVRRCGANVKVRSMDFVGADADLDSTQTLDVLCHLLLSAVAGYAERALSP
jgi:formiminoglutamase